MANHIQFQQVEIRKQNVDGGYVTVGFKLQVRTKDVTSSILGLIPLSSSWSPWEDINTVVVLVDENGNPSS